MRVYLDANFWISGFSERPKDVQLIKEAADQIGKELWVTRQVFHELRWYLRREVEGIIQIDETLMKDIKAFMESIKKPESALPQANDMSLILAAIRAKRSKIVTSDLKLLNTIEDLQLEIEGVVGSAFALELIESVDDEELKKKLVAVRERMYSEEVRYSISRRESYDPVTRIRIIEEHAMQVLRSVKRPAETLDKKLARGQPLFVLDFLEDIKAGLPTMLEDFKDGKYETLAMEIEAVQNEIERLLVVSTLTEDSDTHEKLVTHASDLELFLYYLEMLCHLYRGTREGIEDAMDLSEEAIRLLMFSGVTNDELKASVFFVRYILALVREDFEEIDYTYSLYDGMLTRSGLDSMKQTSEGLYVTMQILREVLGGFSLSKDKLQYPAVTISMLNDVAKYMILFDDINNAWQLAVTAYKIGVAYGSEQGALSSFLMLYKVSSSSQDRFKDRLEKIAENALKFFVKNDWDTTAVTPILHEIQGNIPPVEDIPVDQSLEASDLPEPITGWMDVLTLQSIEDKDTLVVRNDKLQVRVGIDVSGHSELKTLKTGHKIALTRGEFTLEHASPDVVSNFAVALLVKPSEGAEISYEGEYGFSCHQVAEPEAEV
ncbi:MAG: hypothetical protein JSW61_10650 [Candidatus Thorarchaeota archaeon]|nr:MAG: hypothetical protein JSW61_10650 [Candidatus Thorarchaeota archaeon]